MFLLSSFSFVGPRAMRKRAEKITIATDGAREPLTRPYVDLREIPPPAAWGVSIDRGAIDRLAGRLAGHMFEPASYDYEGTPEFSGEDWGRFVLLGVAVVWRLWPPPNRAAWGVREAGGLVEDAPGIWTCFRREPNSLDLDWHAAGGAGVSFFAGEGFLQDVPRRIERLRDVARGLLDLHSGSVLGMIERAGGDAISLRDLLVKTVPGYHDRPDSPAGRLPFDKLANLAVTMLAARLPITGVERFPVFPDYMVPRHLRHEGVLVYADELAADVDEGRLIDPGSTEEMAIRWASIFGAELLRQELSKQGNPVTTPDLDYWLWFEAVLGSRAGAMGRHHLCITEAY